ncbi:MAG TPA: hypothetical protein VMV20_08205, partial [Chitinophagaceae bacterium]|nr:hypothetical protein [Chitinophagaceae bacterium]
MTPNPRRDFHGPEIPPPLREAGRIFIYGSIFIALCAVGLCLETSMLLGTPRNSFPFYLVVFCATLGQYNIHYFIKHSANSNSGRFLWSMTHRRVHLVLSGTGAL